MTYDILHYMLNTIAVKVLLVTSSFLIGFVLRSFLVPNQVAYSNDFEIERIQQGDKIQDMMLVKKVPYKSEFTDKLPVSSNITMHFKGQVQITGNYSFSGPMGSETLEDLEGLIDVCMSEIDEQSLNKLPRPTVKSNDTWFCFDNRGYAIEKLGPVGNKGRTTVLIDNYTINRFPSEVGDTATLLQIQK